MALLPVFAGIELTVGASGLPGLSYGFSHCCYFPLQRHALKRDGSSDHFISPFFSVRLIALSPLFFAQTPQPQK
jgi:hypothetical protein